MGKIDTSDIEGDESGINWFNVVDKNFWALRLVDIKLGSESLGVCKHRECFITPDSGTSCLTMPSWALNQVKSKLPDNAPCASDKEFPDLTYVILDHSGNKRSYTLASEEYVGIEQHTTSPVQMIASMFMPNSEQSQGKCSSIVSALDIKQDNTENLFIVGDAFMQKFKCFFDRDTDRVGISVAKHHH